MDIEDCIAQLEETYEGTPWYGDAIASSLDSISVTFWNQKPVGASHTIAELVWHMIDWRRFVVEKLKGNTTYSIEMNSDQDWRKEVIVQSEGDKTEVLEILRQTQEELLELLHTKSDAWLYEFAEGKDYTNVYMVNGVVQHDIYHLGQINVMAGQLRE